MVTQGAESQWLHRITPKWRLVYGNLPFSMYFTQVRKTPSGTWCSSLHATVQAWHPIHRSWSITNPYLMRVNWTLYLRARRENAVIGSARDKSLAANFLGCRGNHPAIIHEFAANPVPANRAVAYFRVTISSTRRLRARPSSLSFEATGRSAPKPWVAIRSCPTPWLTSMPFTVSARAEESTWLAACDPELSVCPTSCTWALGYAFKI